MNIYFVYKNNKANHFKFGQELLGLPRGSIVGVNQTQWNNKQN